MGRSFRPRPPPCAQSVTTAANIKAAESLWRVHVAAELFLLSCAIAVLVILYVLLRPVHRELAMLAAMFNIVAIAVEAVGALFLDVAPNQSPETTKVLIRCTATVSA